MNTISFVTLLLDRLDYFHGFNNRQHEIKQRIIKGELGSDIIPMPIGVIPDATGDLSTFIKRAVDVVIYAKLDQLSKDSTLKPHEMHFEHVQHVLMQVFYGCQAMAGADEFTFMDVLDGYDDDVTDEVLTQHIVQG